jgi:hypothetical protein
MSRFIVLLGYVVDDKAKELIAASRDWLKGVGVELLAAFGPAVLLALLSRPVQRSAPAPQAQPQAHRKPEKAMKEKTLPIVAQPEESQPAESVATVCDDPAIDGFIGRRIETVQGEFIGATTLYNAWKADCPEQGTLPGSQKAFSQRIQKRIGYDRNSGRPKYCHVRIRPHAAARPRLAVVTA